MVSGPRAPKAVGVDYIAHKTGYSRVTIYRWLHAGHLPPPNPKRRGAKRTVWRKDTIDKWLQDNFE